LRKVNMARIQSENVTSTKRVYDGRIINFRVDSVMLENGGVSLREIVEHRGAVAIVPMLDRETVILVRQYRAAAGGPLLEIPAGTREPDEDPAICARRELAEEINYAARTMIKMYETYQAPGYSTELIHSYLAYGLEPAAGETDEDEFIEIVKMPLTEAVALIGTGDIRDAKTVAGLLYAEKILPGIEM
jgi:ADP-ribose pyrophosphatase